MKNLNADTYSNILIRLRNWVLLVQLLSFVIAKSLRMIDATQLLLGGTLIIVTFVINQIFFVIQKRKFSLFNHLLLDLALVSSALYISGGYQNPLIIVLLIHFLVAPLFLKGRELSLYIGLCFLSLVILRTTSFMLSYPNFTFLDAFEISIAFAAIITFSFSFWFVSRIRDLELSNTQFKTFATRIERYRSLGLLASGVCHELGTPLNTVSMRLERLRNKTDQHEEIEVLERNVQKCVDALRKLNLQVHSEEDHFYEEEIDIVDLISTFSSQNNDYIQFHASKEPLLVQIPKLLLINSLQDILDNAKEAGADWLKISINATPDKVKIQFKDNGMGFPDEVLNQFGIPFLTSKKSGTGLGLYHLNNLMQMIGGHLTLSNKNEGGAYHCLTFPRRNQV